MEAKDKANQAIDGILWAMKKYREHGNIPLTKREQKSGDLGSFDLAERELIQSLKTLGIDFGADWGKDLDLSGI